MSNKSAFARRIGAALLCLSLAGVTAACVEEKDYPAPALIDQAEVTFDTAEAVCGPFVISTVYPGALTPGAADIYFETSGTIDELKVYSGQLVSEGDELMTLDGSATDTRIDGILAEIEDIGVQADFDERRAELTIQYLLTELEKIELTEGTGSVNFSVKSLEIESAQTDRAQAAALRESRLAELEAELTSLQEKKKLEVVTAPHDGYVYVDASVKSGVYVKNGRTVCSVIDSESFELVIDTYIPEEDFQRLTAYALIEGKRYEVTPDPQSSDEIVAKLLAGEPLHGAFFVDDPAHELTPGSYGVLVTEKGHLEAALQIPTNAVMKDSDGSYVYVVNENGAREKTYIKTGQTNQTMTVIQDGLEEGELVYVPE